MRFLQIEWHNHERARNAWDIERAEMKAKIAKQEGVCRHSKRINEQLQRQITMLERALRTERAKNQGKEVKEEQALVSSSPKDNKGKKEKKETRPDQFGMKDVRRGRICVVYASLLLDCDANTSCSF